jgi:protein TonB
MSAITVNAFPPLHTFNSSRSWFLAVIVLVHLGFFWALTHGLGFTIIQPTHEGWIVDVPDDIVDPPPVVPPEPTNVSSGRVDPLPMPREVDDREVVSDKAPQSDPRRLPIADDGAGSAVPIPPVIVPPQADPRFPFTEPDYPVPDIRMGHEGTVWLTIEILPNGRVGAVHIDKSSGFERLDASAVREARKWRMQPGTQDGIALPMYKRVPVTFRLKD